MSLGYTDVALSEFRSFLQQYPNSTYAPEARELLLNVLANTSNYKDALIADGQCEKPLGKCPAVKSPNTLWKSHRAYQRRLARQCI